MVAKGWIEAGISDLIYRITPASEVAMRAKIPIDEGTGTSAGTPSKPT
jgi:hypothetical protein